MFPKILLGIYRLIYVYYSDAAMPQEISFFLNFRRIFKTISSNSKFNQHFAKKNSRNFLHRNEIREINSLMRGGGVMSLQSEKSAQSAPDICRTCEAPYLHLSIYLSLSIYPSINLSINLSDYLSTYLPSTACVYAQGPPAEYTLYHLCFTKTGFEHWRNY